MATMKFSKMAAKLPVSSKVLRLKPSSTLAINETSKKLAASGKKVYRLGFGQSPFPVPSIVVEALKENAFQKDYLPPKGLMKLREAVADFHARLHGFSPSAEDVFVGPGSKELMFILQLIWDGKVLIPSPSWVSYEPQAKLIGRDVVWLPTSAADGWRLSPETLDEFSPSGPSLLILNYPSNPTGATYSEKQLSALAESARRNNILVLSDEIYGELTYTGKHVSLAKFYPEGTIVSSGLSKWCGAGGWRLGTFCFPKELRQLSDLMATVASETFSAVSAPIQYAAISAFEPSDETEAYRRSTRSILGALGNEVAKRLRGYGVETAYPEGGFYLFPDFKNVSHTISEKGISGSVQFCDRLLEETGVALLPGADFGRPSEELTCRLAYVDFDGSRCLKSLGGGELVNEEFLKENCGEVLAAIEIIGAWLKD